MLTLWIISSYVFPAMLNGIELAGLQKRHLGSDTRTTVQKTKPYSHEQVSEYERSTKDLSLLSRGAWIALRKEMNSRNCYMLERSPEELALLLRCSSADLLTCLKEFELKNGCGFRIEKPPPNGARTESILVVYEPGEKSALLSSSESLRLAKYREDKKNKEKKRMPENWNLNERMLEFGLKNGMTHATVQHEFEKCRTYHLESEQTAIGWEYRTFYSWVLNWVSYGRKQINGHESKARSMVDLL